MKRCPADCFPTSRTHWPPGHFYTSLVSLRISGDDDMLAWLSITCHVILHSKAHSREQAAPHGGPQWGTWLNAVARCGEQSLAPCAAAGNEFQRRSSQRGTRFSALAHSGEQSFSAGDQVLYSASFD
jgi:hypothetical protein